MTATALFPNLRMLYCWTSASAGHYVRELRSALPEGVVVADGVYAANEGWNNVPLGDGMLGGPVAVHGHVYEFIEESAWEAGSREGCGAAELEPGKRYRVVVTTSAGVFRYDLGDVVKCTGFYGRTPRIHFDGRAAGAYNLAGEKMHESHVREAMDATTTALGLAPLWFAAVPNPSGKPRWELFAEFADVPAREALRTFRTEFERRLADSCTDYRLAERLMRPLALHILLPGTTDKLRAQATAQSKWLHLDSNREKWDKVPVHTTIEKE